MKIREWLKEKNNMKIQRTDDTITVITSDKYVKPFRSDIIDAFNLDNKLYKKWEILPKTGQLKSIYKFDNDELSKYAEKIIKGLIK